MEWDGPTLVNLGDVLAHLYPTKEDSYRVVVDAGLDRRRIRFNDAAILNWFNILQYAKHQEQVNDIVEVALRDYPENEYLRLARERGGLPVVKGADIRSSVSWRGPSGGEIEKVIGPENTLVDVSFLEVGARRARAVARVRLASGSIGSGFLINGRLLITTHHVIPDAGEARLAEIDFNYQKTPDGFDAPVDCYHLTPDTFFKTSKDDDWTVVAVSGNPEAKWGSLELADIDIAVGERVNIIQHPAGGPKQISFFHNTVTFVGNDRVQYLTDTLPGSSGAPVFDKHWRVVALHHSGGWLSETGMDRVKTYFRNEGIHIRAIIRALREGS